MKKRIFLGVFLTILLLLTACGGKNNTFENISADDFKKFVKEEKTGFIFVTYLTDHEKENAEQVKKSLKKNNQTGKYFNFNNQVKNDESRTFFQDIGTDQSTDSLGYYKKGILQGEFKFPLDWKSDDVKKLNEFVSKFNE